MRGSRPEWSPRAAGRGPLRRAWNHVQPSTPSIGSLTNDLGETVATSSRAQQASGVGTFLGVTGLGYGHRATAVAVSSARNTPSRPPRLPELTGIRGAIVARHRARRRGPTRTARPAAAHPRRRI